MDRYLLLVRLKLPKESVPFFLQIVRTRQILAKKLIEQKILNASYSLGCKKSRCQSGYR